MENIQNNKQIETVNLEENVDPKKKTWVTPDVISDDVGSVTSSTINGTGGDNVIYS